MSKPEVSGLEYCCYHVIPNIVCHKPKPLSIIPPDINSQKLFYFIL